MRNIRLVLEYDGTGFVGWQTQSAGRTVQQEVSRVLCQVLQEEVNLIGAGRTDSGVHARGQVANFRTDASVSLSSLFQALSGLLPPDICVHAVDEVPEKFHARYDASGRRYCYAISRVPTAIGRQYVWLVRYELDTEAMKRVAGSLLGEHDFGAFCKTGSEVEHHRCTVTESGWREDGTRLIYGIRANRFLHGMVRALVGTMVDVGRGYRPEGEFADILASRDRRRAGMAAPPQGLVLEEVFYPPSGN